MIRARRRCVVMSHYLDVCYICTFYHIECAGNTMQVAEDTGPLLENKFKNVLHGIEETLSCSGVFH